MFIYTTKTGDTLYEIGKRYGVSVEQIVLDNQISSPDKIVAGMDLVLPIDRIKYTVVRGDSLYKIARQYGVSVQDLISANPELAMARYITPGMEIVVPLNSIKKLGDAEVNGYAYPTISDQIVGQTAPYLTYMAMFSYQVKPDGTLYEIDTTRVLQQLPNYDVKPLMVITNIDDGGTFSSELASGILHSTSVQENLIANILEVLRQSNYYGLDVDFEYLYPDDREFYISFLQRLADAIKPEGYLLSVAVAPKISSTQQGTLYEAHDYNAIGKIVDRLIVMTYEWGYLYGPPLAVAPIGPVEQVLQYAVSEVDSRKILMGMPNYGYDWTLPYVSGKPARILTNVQAVDQAIKYGVNIQYDEKSQAPFYNYVDAQGRRHIVWFDNARSTYARLNLIKKYNLAGASYWNLNSFFKQNWLVLDAMYNIVKKWCKYANMFIKKSLKNDFFDI